MINRLIFKINELLKSKDCIVVAIDGMAGSGKTTIANKIKELYDGNIIHIDDFYLPFLQHQKEKIGGNMDLNRFKEEVIYNIDKDIKYSIFDCSVQKIVETVNLVRKSILIVEGTFCMHDELGHYYDLGVFIEIDENTQLSRLKKRENPYNFDRFINIWLPNERRYFSNMNIKENADLVIINE